MVLVYSAIEYYLKVSRLVNDENTLKEGTCPACNSPDIKILFTIPNVPVHCNLLWETRDEALNAPRSDITLGFCENCEHIFNLTFDPDLMEYTQRYENSLHFSQYFQNYANELVTRLIKKYNLYDKDIIEIGCGKGEFLTLLCEMGGNRGVGFDKSFENDERMGRIDSKSLTFIKDFYSERYSNYKSDMICCRQVLEHIQFPRDFLIDLRNVIGNKCDNIVFFEVPNVNYTLKDLGIWDLIYEHRSYFSKNSIARLFTSCGFKISNLTETYGGQFLCIETRPNGSLSDTGNEKPIDINMKRIIQEFAKKYEAKIEEWQEMVKIIQKSGHKTVLWGGGSKGVTFLNMIGAKEQIEYVIDINPHKQGKYIPGTGQRIVSPEFLRDYRPDVVIVMNPIYKNEIGQIIDDLGLTTQIMLV